MNIETLTIYHLIKSEDLNHHGTLFAGRGAEWMLKSLILSFIKGK